MKLVLQRTQQEKGMMSKTVEFTLKAQVELSPQESENIKKYKVGSTVLFSSVDELPESNWKALATIATSTTITVDRLVAGSTYTAKDITELLLLEDAIKQGCENFKALLESMSTYADEEVIEYA